MWAAPSTTASLRFCAIDCATTATSAYVAASSAATASRCVSISPRSRVTVSTSHSGRGADRRLTGPASGEVPMSFLGFLLLLLVAAVAGGIGQALVGFSRGG